MTTVVKKEYVPIPQGVYNVRILKYELRPSGKGGNFYIWTFQVLDALPAEFTGRDQFTILTADELTENNNLSKLLQRVGVEVPVGEAIDLDTLLNYAFVGKLTVKRDTRGRMVNDLGDMTYREFEQFSGSVTAPVQQPVQRPPVQRPPVQQQAVQRQAPAQTVAQPPQNPVQRGVRPPARPAPAPAGSRPMVRPVVPQQSVEVSTETYTVEGGAEENFPENV